MNPYCGSLNSANDSICKVGNSLEGPFVVKVILSSIPFINTVSLALSFSTQVNAPIPLTDAKFSTRS